MLMRDLQLIGREEQVAQLDRCLSMTKPQLIVVYGRRRVGKTYMIDTYFDNRFAFKFTGVYRRRRKKQLSNFNKELYLKSGKQLPAFEDWDDVLARKRLKATLTSGQNAVFEYLSAHPEATHQQVADSVGLSLAGVKKIVGGLTKSGLLTREGSKKAGKWVVLK